MEEVQTQLGPLKQAVELQGRNLDRLFNTNGGPEGFLQSARREDNTRFENERQKADGRFDMIFAMLKEFKNDVRPLKQFMSDHIAAEKQKTLDEGLREAALATRVAESERRFKRWLGLATLFLAGLTFIMNAHGCSQVKALLAPEQVNHSQNTPQNAKGD